MERISINDNESKYIKPSMNNDNEGTNKLSINSLQVDDTANYLVEKFGSPDSREFYCKVAYRIQRSRIDNLVVRAFEKGAYPGRLFNYLVRKEMGEI